MNYHEITELISGISPFKGISESSLEALCSCQIKEYKAGQTICSPDSTDKSLIVLLSGEAEIYSADSQKRVLLRKLERGGVVGVANLFSEGGFLSLVVAQKTCRTLDIPKSIFCRTMSHDPVLLENFLSLLSGKIRYLNRKIICLTAGSAERRLAIYLDSVSPSDSFALPLSMVALSEMLDLGRASLYRAFDKLCDDGFISRDGKRITIIQRKKMLEHYQ